MTTKVIKIGDKALAALINPHNSQMYSLKSGGVEVMWGGGGPGEKPAKGWPSSEIVMFPIVGPAPKERIRVNGKAYPMSQHGIARDLPWEIVEQKPNSVTMVQVYEAGGRVTGKKGAVSEFPISYRLTKTYSIDNGALNFNLVVENTGENDMPYAVGWHPTFRALENSFVEVRNGHDFVGSAPIERIAEAGGNVMVFEKSNRVVYATPEFHVVMEHDFGILQLWNKGEGLVGIEPITAVKMNEPVKGMDAELSGQPGYETLLRGKSATYTVSILVALPKVPEDMGSSGK
ncbi:MAG: hypothetical protein KGH98_02800 [Candidatus Micrarchaeota archaeon]|nr:hypothetical protein [Candidatus Micrarchaeota archaeon]